MGDYMLLMMSLAWPSTMMMMLTMVLTDPALAEFLRCSLAHQRGEAARISLGEGDLASLRCYSWAEGCYTDCCSSSMATTLGLLWGRMEERKEIDEMTTYAQLPRH